MKSKAYLVFVVSVLAGCQSAPPLSKARKVDSPDKVANIYVSAYPAVPWADISAKLEPKHNIGTAEARAMASIATQGEISQFLSTFSAGLGIGLQNRSKSFTSTTSSDGTTVSSHTQKTEPGIVPTTSGVNPATFDSLSLSPISASTAPVAATDAATTLMAGTAAYQLAAILDNQLSKSLKLPDYEAYLITFQVNLQPLARDLPYDTYINLSLIPSSWNAAVHAAQQSARGSGELPPIIIYPLVVADALETSNVGRSVEIIRQASLALSGLVSNIGANAGISGGSNNFDTIVGSDRNSLVTVGRVNDSSLRIRIGAQYQGSSRLAMTPKTQNVSIVAFVKSGEDPATYIDRISAVTRTEFFDAENGEKLIQTASESDIKTLEANVRKVLFDNGLEYRAEGNCLVSSPTETLLDAVDRAEYQYLDECLITIKDEKIAAQRTSIDTTSPPPPSGATSRGKQLQALSKESLTRLKQILADEPTRSLASATREAEAQAGITFDDILRRREAIASLVGFRVNARQSNLIIPLRAFATEVYLPPNDYLVILKDNKSSTTAILTGAKNQKKTFLDGHLAVTTNGERLKLAPTSFQVNAEGDIITINFPSLHTNKLMTLTEAKDTRKVVPSPPVPMSLILSSRPPKADAKRKEQLSIQYPVRLLEAEAEALSSPVKVSSAYIVADRQGLGQVQIVVGSWEQANGDLALRITGAEIRSVNPAASLDASKNAVLLKPESVISISLGNLSPLQPVELSTFASGASLSGKLTLPVLSSNRGDFPE